MSLFTDLVGRFRSLFSHRSSISLEYFEGILPVELDFINRRRGDRDPVQPLPPKEGIKRDLEVKGFTVRPTVPPEAPSRRRSPDPNILFGSGRRVAGARRIEANPRTPDPDATRPQPVPCTATGLALSGGGIRSAAVCLGAMQALQARGRLSSIDYLSTVSGGGYIGACLSAAMSPDGGGKFPFGADIIDSDAVAHLRNYSNYLLPRGRSGVRNAAEAAVILLRGLLANALIVLTSVLLLAIGTYALTIGISEIAQQWTPFEPALIFGGLLAILLLGWAVWRSFPRARSAPSDTRGPVLRFARYLLLATIIFAFLGVQPRLIEVVQDVHLHGFANSNIGLALRALSAALLALAGTLSAFSGTIGRFLEATVRTDKKSTLALRVVTRGALVVAACVLPLAIWLIYLNFSAALIHRWRIPGWARFDGFRDLLSMNSSAIPPALPAAMSLLVFGLAISAFLGANGYSLHRFYRDRLSRAFLFNPNIRPEPEWLDDLRLSALQKGEGPYHILNAALNVQASAEANRRGRNADFFIFTPDFIGSDLTMYSATTGADRGFAPTIGMEAVDPRLDLATAVAISGAAVSANMGSSTIRVLSPTLALLNIRLGYWLANPRALARKTVTRFHIRTLFRNIFEKFYLLAEMLNLLDETSSVVFLTDGGHIENLGIYELLKRGCQTIIAIDAEADPDLAFPSLLRLERYARIDLGVRISLPWEPIASTCRTFSEQAEGDHRFVSSGPHCAVGRIYYADDRVGTLVYFKASLTGDEKDYVLDYRRRHSAFPHETTGDQFFSEEQFEVYRTLGYHMVDHFFGRNDRFTYCTEGAAPFEDEDDAFREVDSTIPITVTA